MLEPAHIAITQNLGRVVPVCLEIRNPLGHKKLQKHFGPKNFFPIFTYYSNLNSKDIQKKSPPPTIGERDCFNDY